MNKLRFRIKNPFSRNPKLSDDIGEEISDKRSFMLEILIGVMVIAMMFIYFLDRIMIDVPAGCRGVLFKTLGEGTVTQKSYGEGLLFIFPWDVVTIYDVKILAGQDTIHALTKDGLSVSAEISYRYRIKADSVGFMHKQVGENYKDKIIIPHITPWGKCLRNTLIKEVFC